MNRWVWMLLGILFFVGILALRNYFILQTTGSAGNETSPSGFSPSVVPSSVVPSGGVTGAGGGAVSAPAGGNTTSLSGGSIPNTTNVSGGNLPNVPQSATQIPQTQSSFPQATGNSLPQPAAGTDQTTLQHTSPTGGRDDIEQIGSIIVSQQQAYTGDDITFTVTIKNTASYKKFVRSLCFQSSEGNFGCSPGFNLDPGQVFGISNSGRFESTGIKSVWITWTQDNTNYYTPVHSLAATVQIL